MHTPVYTHTYIFILIYAYTQTYAYTYLYIYLYTQSYIYTHIYSQTYVHTYSHNIYIYIIFKCNIYSTSIFFMYDITVLAEETPVFSTIASSNAIRNYNARHRELLEIFNALMKLFQVQISVFSLLV